MGGTFQADVPALDKKGIEFRIYYISPLGSFATWKSTKQQAVTICKPLKYTHVLYKR